MNGIPSRGAGRSVWRVRVAWMVLALIAALYCGWRFVGSSPLQTDLLALLPATEVDPVAEKAVDRLAATLGNRVVFLINSDDPARAKAAALQFGAALTSRRAFASVTAKLPPFDVSQISRFYLPYRFSLLTAEDRAALESNNAFLDDALMRRLYSPVRGGLSTPLADDPFAWLDHWLAALPLATSKLEIDGGMLVTHDGARTQVLVIATLPGSAYESKIQSSVLDAVAQAEAALHTAYPDVTLVRTGAIFYASAARAASEREVHRIGIVSVLGIALLMLWVFRSPRLLLLGFVSTALGILCALSVTMLVFGKLHLLTLVFGASLIGEAVDYSIQYFVVYLGAKDDWHPQRAVRAVRPALTVALATSLLGYAILAWVPFPALKQIACFAMVGVGVAFASVLWLLPALLTRPPTHRSERLFSGSTRLLMGWQRLIGGRRAWRVAMLLVAVAIPGWAQLTSDDDIRLLIQRDPVLFAQEQQVRAAVGIDNSAQFFLVRGATPEIMLQRAEALGDKLDQLTGVEQIDGRQSLASFVPSEQRQRADRALLDSRVFNEPAKVRAVLMHAGFREDAVDGWFRAHADADASAHTTAAAAAGHPPLTVERWLTAPWSVPFRHLWLGDMGVDTGHGAASSSYATVVLPQGVTAANLPALNRIAAQVEGVAFVDKAASVSRLFGAYRVDSGLWLAGVLLVVLIVLMVRYRPRGGVAVIAPVVLAVAVTLAMFGYFHVPLNLFNWLALMLVMGVGANYAVFLREGCLRPDANLGAVWVGVLLSAATTLLSFGLLAMSDMPALKSFGATLSMGIALSVLLAPIGMSTTYRREA